MKDTIELIVDHATKVVIERSAVIYVQSAASKDDRTRVGLISGAELLVGESFDEIMKKINPYWDMD